MKIFTLEGIFRQLQQAGAFQFADTDDHIVFTAGRVDISIIQLCGQVNIRVLL